MYHNSRVIDILDYMGDILDYMDDIFWKISHQICLGGVQYYFAHFVRIPAHSIPTAESIEFNQLNEMISLTPTTLFVLSGEVSHRFLTTKLIELCCPCVGHFGSFWEFMTS